MKYATSQDPAGAENHLADDKDELGLRDIVNQVAEDNESKHVSHPRQNAIVKVCVVNCQRALYDAHAVKFGHRFEQDKRLPHDSPGLLFLKLLLVLISQELFRILRYQPRVFYVAAGSVFSEAFLKFFLFLVFHVSFNCHGVIVRTPWHHAVVAVLFMPFLPYINDLIVSGSFWDCGELWTCVN